MDLLYHHTRVKLVSMYDIMYAVCVTLSSILHLYYYCPNKQTQRKLIIVSA